MLASFLDALDDGVKNPLTSNWMNILLRTRMEVLLTDRDRFRAAISHLVIVDGVWATYARQYPSTDRQPFSSWIKTHGLVARRAQETASAYDSLIEDLARFPEPFPDPCLASIVLCLEIFDVAGAEVIERVGYPGAETVEEAFISDSRAFPAWVSGLFRLCEALTVTAHLPEPLRWALLCPRDPLSLHFPADDLVFLATEADARLKGGAPRPPTRPLPALPVSADPLSLLRRLFTSRIQSQEACRSFGQRLVDGWETLHPDLRDHLGEILDVLQRHVFARPIWLTSDILMRQLGFNPDPEGEGYTVLRPEEHPYLMQRGFFLP